MYQLWIIADDFYGDTDATEHELSLVVYPGDNPEAICERDSSHAESELNGTRRPVPLDCSIIM